MAESNVPEYGEHGYQSDMSEVFQYAEETDITPILLTQHSAGSKLGEVDSIKKPADVTLFKVKGNKPSFLRRRSKDSSNVFTNGLNKLTFGGLDKVTNSIDKLKEYVHDTPKRRKRKEKGLSKTEYESDVDLSDTGIPSANLATPTLQVEETTGEVTTISSSTYNPPTLLYDPDLLIAQAKKDTRQYPEPLIQRETIPVVKQPIDIWENIKLVITKIWRIHREATIGPRKLGPINTALYDRSRLEESFIELFSEIFEFNYRQSWIYTQLHFFIKPMIVGLGGHIINR
jgi:hypothetical protein